MLKTILPLPPASRPGWRAALLALVLAWPLAAPAQTAPCAPAYVLSSGAVTNTTYAYVTQQSFTATCTGKLTTLTIKPTFGSDDLRNTGYYVIPSIKNATGSTMLATLSRTDQYYGIGQYASNTNPNTITFDFSAANVVLTAGTQYRWELAASHDARDPNGNVLSDQQLITGSYKTGNPYAGGEYIADGVSQTGQDIVGWTINIVDATPTLSSISPNPAPAGATITLTGTNFTGATQVTFGAGGAFPTNATPTVVNATTITVTVPAGFNTGNVTVTTPGGTSSGVSFTVAQAATVLSSPINSPYPSSNSTTMGGNVSSDNGYTVTERGVVYVQGSGTPTTANTKVMMGSGTGTFTQLVTGLTPNTTYTYRAYAINAGGTSYGANVTFTTIGAIPMLSGVSPTSGAVGSTITLDGTNLQGITGVTFVGTTTTLVNTGYTINAAGTQITGIVVPTGATSGTVDVLYLTYIPGPPGFPPVPFAMPSNALTFSVTPAAPQNLTISTGSSASPTSVAAGTYNNVTITGTGYAQLSGAVVVNGALTVQGGGSLSTNCQSLTGSGSFTLAAGGTLLICDAGGISATGATGAVRLTGPRSYASDATYVYNGTVAQITGAGLPAQVHNLRTDNAASLTLSQPLAIRQVLTLEGEADLATNGQNLTLLSDATGTALLVNVGPDKNQVRGNMTVQRYIDGSTNAGLGYRHLAAPALNLTVAAFTAGGAAPVVNPQYNTAAQPGLVTPFPTVFRYDQDRLATSPATSLSAFDKGWESPAALADAAEVGSTGFTVQLPGASTLSFTGGAFQDGMNIFVRRNAGATAPDAGWNFVGNPYAAPLDLSTITAAQRTNVDAAFYIFESTSRYGGQYRSYVNGVGASPLVGSSQAFWIRTTAGQTDGRLLLRNDNRVTTYAQQAPVRRGPADQRPQLQLTLAGPAGTDALYVYAQTGASAALDGEFDAAKLPNTSGLNLASLTATGEALAIDGRADFAAATSIPLTVGVPAAGSYTLRAAALANLTSTRAELVDNLTNTRTVLAAGTAYAFTMTGTTAPGRFWLSLTPAAAPLATAPALDAQVLAYPNPAHMSLTVLRPAAKLASATLLNSLGQTIRTLALPTAETTVDLRGLAAGVYTLRLVLDGQPVTKRVVVE